MSQPASGYHHMTVPLVCDPSGRAGVEHGGVRPAPGRDDCYFGCFTTRM